MVTTQATFQELKQAGLDEIDPEIARLIGAELERQRGQIELIASENFTWPAVLEAIGSVPTNKYAEGYPGRRYYGGCEVIDEIEQLAIDRARELFGAEHANVQPHAGAQTNMAVYASVMAPGETLMALALNQGGHLTHGHKVNFSGRLYNVAHYEVSRETMTVDYDDVLAKAKRRVQGDRLRRVCLSARWKPTDSGRSRTRSARSSSATWSTSPGCRRGSPAEPGRGTPRSPRPRTTTRRSPPARRLDPLPRGARRGARAAVMPGDQGGCLSTSSRPR